MVDSKSQPFSGKTRSMVSLVKSAANERIIEVLSGVAGISPELLDGKHHPCPKCGGTDRFRLIDAEKGAVFCNQCFSMKNGDWIAAVMWMRDCSFSDAVAFSAEHLGVSPGLDEIPHEDVVISEICTDKCMPVEGLRAFGVKAAKRGRQPVARVPVYNERGEQHSYFDLIPKQKGLFKRGKGSAGMFFPSCLPQPGETWMVVEGVKDAAALVSLGYLAAGIPTSSMNAKYGRLFRGCHVRLIHDLDHVGLVGANLTVSRLEGVAATVGLVRMPGQLVESGGDDVRDLIRKTGGEQQLRQAINDAVVRSLDREEGTGPRRVFLSHDEDTVINEVVEALAECGDNGADGDDHFGSVYQRSGQLVHVTETATPQASGVRLPRRMLRIRPMPAAVLRGRISSATMLVVEASDPKDGLRRIRPPLWLVSGIHQRGEYPRRIPPLSGLVRCPTLRQDGSVLQTPGYDSKTGLLFVPDVQFPIVPGRPSHADAKRAANQLVEVVSEFPFKSRADQSAWLTLVLTLVGRPAIEGNCPLIAIDANTRGSGKSLLCDVAAMIAYGDSMPRKAWTRDDDELRKVITSVALEAIPVILFDNVASVLGTANLDAALTGTTWQDRILGKSETTGVLPLTTVFVATGNNLEVGADTARRTLFCQLESLEEHPEDRSGFAIPRLMDYMQENWAELAVAAVTMLRAFIVAGRPGADTLHWGGFESWSELVRGAVLWVGLEDPVKTREVVRAADQGSYILRLLLDGVEEADTGEGVTTAELVRLVSHPLEPDDPDKYSHLRAAVEELCGKSVTSQKLGYRLRKYTGRVCGGRRLMRVEGHSRQRRWAVEPVADATGTITQQLPDTSSPLSPSSPIPTDARVQGVV